MGYYYLPSSEARLILSPYSSKPITCHENCRLAEMGLTASHSPLIALYSSLAATKFRLVCHDAERTLLNWRREPWKEMTKGLCSDDLRSPSHRQNSAPPITDVSRFVDRLACFLYDPGLNLAFNMPIRMELYSLGRGAFPAARAASRFARAITRTSSGQSAGFPDLVFPNKFV